MSKLQTFLNTIKNSAFKPNYYQDVLKAPFSFSLKYFLLLFFTLSFLTAGLISFFLNQNLKPYLEKIKTQAPDLYPQELIITIKNGDVSTNQSEPYFIPLRPELFPSDIDKVLRTQPIQNLLVIDTQAPASEIRKYQTLALLTKNDLAFVSQNNEIRIQSLAEVKDFTLNRQLIDLGWEKVTPFFAWIIPSLIVLIIIFLPLGTILGKFIYLALFSLVTLLTSRLFRPTAQAPLGKFSYAKALQINLQAITLPTIIVAVFQLLGSQPKIPFFESIILLIFNLLIFSSLKTNNE